MFETPSKNFQQVFHYGFHLEQRRRCFRREISWRGWLINWTVFFPKSSTYERSVNNYLVRRIISGCYQYLQVYDLYCFEVFSWVCASSQLAEKLTAGIHRREKTTFVGKRFMTFHESFMSVPFDFYEGGRTRKGFRSIFIRSVILSSSFFRALKQKDMCIICVKVSSFRSAQSVLYRPTNCVHPPYPSPNENSEIFHDGSPQLRAFFSSLLLWWIKLSLVKKFLTKTKSEKKRPKLLSFSNIYNTL